MSQPQLGLSLGAAGSPTAAGLGPSGAVSLNHFLASFRILFLSSGLRRETRSWTMSPHIGRWVQTIVSVGLIMAVAPPSMVERVSASLTYL